MRPYLQTLEMEESGIRFSVVDNLCFPAHWHLQCEIVYVLDGVFCAGVNRQQYELKQGDMLAVGSNEIHHYSTRDSRILLIIFHPGIVGQEDGWPHGGCFTAPVVRRGGIDAPVRELLGYAVSQTEANSLIQRGIVNLLCAFLQGRAGFAAGGAETAIPHKLVQEAIRYIDQNYQEEISLAQIAGQINISKYHLSRKFKEYTGMSIPQHVNSVRLYHAEQMLREGSKSISDIAYECGFNSLRNFNRVFFGKHGQAPAAFRRGAQTKRK